MKSIFRENNDFACLMYLVWLILFCTGLFTNSLKLTTFSYLFCSLGLLFCDGDEKKEKMNPIIVIIGTLSSLVLVLVVLLEPADLSEALVFGFSVTVPVIICKFLVLFIRGQIKKKFTSFLSYLLGGK